MRSSLRLTVVAACLALLPFSVAAADPSPALALPACQHFYPGPIPDRPPSPGSGPGQEIRPVNVSHRLPAPADVAGARAYRAFRNGQALQWIDDWGQPELRVADGAPCHNANYQVLALADGTGTAAGTGQISGAYRLSASNLLAPYRIPAGTRLSYKITAYNDLGRTALGYDAGPGFCAVDARIVPWGTRFYVPGYGHCYAADIGSWIKGDIADVWLPGVQADNWGVQIRELVVQ